MVESPSNLKTVSYDKRDRKSTDVSSLYLGVPKKDWKVIAISSGDRSTSELLIDENPDTFWATDEKVTAAQEILIDLGQVEDLKGFTYWPIQERYLFGILTDYEFSNSIDAKGWKIAAAGEFANIVNSRLEQRIDFPLAKAGYVKLKAKKVDGAGFRASFAEVGVLTKE